MFVVSWYGNNKIASELSHKKQVFENHYLNKRETGRTQKAKEYNYLKNDDWYRYLFNDGGSSPTCQNSEMKQELLQKHTYARWADTQTFYGVTCYSFVALTDKGDFAKNVIQTHVKTMYYQMVVLSLMQRASILRFSGEVTKISELDFENSDNEAELKEIKSINSAYLKFSNQMYFREVTAQEQGIELFDMIQEKMRIERDVKDLNREIDELYQFAKLLEDEKERNNIKEQNNNMGRISLIGAIFLVPTLLTGLFGMNTIKYDYVRIFGSNPDWNFIISIGLVIIISAIIIGVGYFVLNKKRKN